MSKNKTQKPVAPVEQTISTIDDIVYELIHPNLRGITVFVSKDLAHSVTSMRKGNAIDIKFDGKWIHDGAQLRRKLTGIEWSLQQRSYY